MKKIMSGIMVIVASLLLLSVTSSATTVHVPWYNESSSYNTWVMLSNQSSSVVNASNGTGLTIQAYNTAGTSVGSTNPTIAANGVWVFSIDTAITAITTTVNQRGRLVITDVSSELDSLSIMVIVQHKTAFAGFRIPLIADGHDFGDTTIVGTAY